MLILSLIVIAVIHVVSYVWLIIGFIGSITLFVMRWVLDIAGAYLPIAFTFIGYLADKIVHCMYVVFRYVFAILWFQVVVRPDTTKDGDRVDSSAVLADGKQRVLFDFAGYKFGLEEIKYRVIDAKSIRKTGSNIVLETCSTALTSVKSMKDSTLAMAKGGGNLLSFGGTTGSNLFGHGLSTLRRTWGAVRNEGTIDAPYNGFTDVNYPKYIGMMYVGTDNEFVGYGVFVGRYFVTKLGNWVGNEVIVRSPFITITPGQWQVKGNYVIFFTGVESPLHVDVEAVIEEDPLLVRGLNNGMRTDVAMDGFPIVTIDGGVLGLGMLSNNTVHPFSRFGEDEKTLIESRYFGMGTGNSDQIKL